MGENKVQNRLSESPVNVKMEAECIRLFIRKIYFIGRVFSTEKLFPTRVPQYWANGVKGRCKGDEYSKTPKNP